MEVSECGARKHQKPGCDTDLTFERIAFTPQVLMVLIRVSRELLEDSVNINTALPNIIAASMAQELDRVVYLGSGSSNEPAGLDNIANVQSLDHGSAAIADFTPFTQARRMLLNENVERIGPWVMAPDLEEDVANLTDSNNQPLQHPGVLDPFETLTTSIESEGRLRGMVSVMMSRSSEELSMRS